MRYKNNKLIVVLLISMLIIFSGSSAAFAGTWQKDTSITGDMQKLEIAPDGSIWAFYQNSYRYYAYRWNGSTWEYKGMFSDYHSPLRDVAYDPNTGYPVVSTPLYIYKYNGTSWQNLGNPTGKENFLGGVLADSNGDIWVGMEYQRVYRYKNGSWENMRHPYIDFYGASKPVDLAEDPNKPGRIWALNSSCYLRYYENGTWYNTSAPTPYGTINTGHRRIIFNQDKKLYLINYTYYNGNKYGHVHRYEGGTSWTSFTFGGDMFHDVTLAPNNKLFIVGDGGHVVEFTGSDFITHSNLPGSGNVKSLAIDKDGIIWAIRGSYLYKYDTRVDLSAVYATQTSINLNFSWENRALDSMVLQRSTDGINFTNVKTVSGNSTTDIGLEAGTLYYYRLISNPINTGATKQWFESGITQIRTVPPTPPSPSGEITVREWSAIYGRGKIILKWPSCQGATGYKVWVHDGNTYRAFDVGDNTTWDSSIAKIYPSESWLDAQAGNSVSTDPFNHAQGGYDLRDDPNKLYLKTTGSTYDSSHNYRFAISAYNESGETPISDAYMPTLPDATDTQQPTGSVNLTSAEGLDKTYNANVIVQFDINDTESGVKRFGLSNDNSVWTWYPYMHAEFTDNPEEFLQSDRCNNGLGSESGVNYLRVTDTAGDPGTNNWHGLKRAVNAENIVPGESYYLKIRYRTGNYIKGNVAIWSHWLNSSGASVQSSDYVLPASSSWVEKTIVQTAPIDAAKKHFIIGFNRTNAGAYIDVDWIEYGPGDGSKQLNWVLSPGAGTKTVYMKADDCVGNTSTFSDTIALADDMLPPSISLSIDDGTTSTTSNNVTLTISVTDNASTTSQMQMAFSNDGNLWSPWEPYQQTKSWDITNSSYGGATGAGVKKVYCRIYDNAQNIGLASAEIGYNPSPPTGTLSVSSGVTGTYNGKSVIFISGDTPTLNIDATGASKIRYDSGIGIWSDWEDYVSNKEIVLAKSSGVCLVRIQVKDNYGVTSDPEKVLVVIDGQAPVISSLKTLSGATATTVTSIDLIISVQDNISKNLQYDINGGTKQILPADNIITAPISGSGLVQITVNVYDEAGNKSSQSIPVWVL